MVRGSSLLDRECLLALYWSSGGPRWTRQQGWAEIASHLKDWHGVKTNEQGRVVQLDLSKNNLSGTLPAALGCLGELSVLRLGSNSLTGPIPGFLGNLTELTYLDLRSNQFTGSIPPEFGRLKEMAKLDISCNLISGTIPPELGGMENLMLLWLEKNHIEGPIPPELANIPHLTDVDLSENRVAEGRLQGKELQRWRDLSRRRGSVSTNPQAVLETIMRKDQEIKDLRDEVTRLTAENNNLKTASGGASTTKGFFSRRRV